MKLAFRAPDSTRFVLTVPADTTTAILRKQVAEKIAAADSRTIRLLCGFPPKPLQPSQTTSLTEVGIKSGESIIVELGPPVEDVAPAAPAPGASVSDAAPVNAAAEADSPNSADDEEAETLAKAIAMSQAGAPSSPPAAEESTKAAPQSSAVAASSSPTAAAGPVSPIKPAPVKPLVRRAIPDDNSCLFNAVGYSLDGKQRNSASFLRSVVANIVEADPATYNAVFLGKPTKDYARYIQDPKIWGGAIELSILSAYFQAEIGAVDIETGVLYKYGEQRGYKQRAYLIYNGVHYDALVHNPADEDSPAIGRGGGLQSTPAIEKQDVTLFSPDDAVTEVRARLSARLAKQNKQFTNMNKFSLRCTVCQEGLVGQVEAVEHMKITGHRNFNEY